MKDCFISVPEVKPVYVPYLKQTSWANGKVSYGANDKFPQEVYNVVRNCSYLNAIIDGTLSLLAPSDSFLRSIYKSLLMYGAAPLSADDSKLYDHRYLRNHADRSKFYWQPPLHNLTIIDASDIHYIALDNDGPYPTPYIYSCLKAACVLNSVQDFNINQITNEFTPSAMINFATGMPDDDTRREIEQRIREKFCGSTNAGRLIVSFSDSKDTAPSISTIPQVQISDRFKTVTESCKEQLFTTFHATPSVFGIPSNRVGFSREEYDNQFILFKEFTLRPLFEFLKSELPDIVEPLILSKNDNKSDSSSQGGANDEKPIS